jgi:indolepyruvate ferredoxin oxidoreductase, beta subunit
MGRADPAGSRVTQTPRPVRILVGTVGGQGGGLLCDWLVKGLLNAGWQAQSIGLLGLSQRAGSVVYYVEARPPGSAPFFAAYAAPADVDLVLAQEFLELGRILQGGYAREGCTVIANTYRYYGTLEKTPAEGGVYPSGVIRRAAEELAGDAYLFHAQELVARAGLSHLSSNAVLLGAVAASRPLDLPAEPFEAAIREAEVGVEDNLKAFALGYSRMRAGTLPRSDFNERPVLDWAGIAAEREERLPRGQRGAYRTLLEEAREAHPAMARIHAEALYRLIDFQSVRYAHAYLRRVDELAVLERARGANAELPVTAAYAQHLAMWMGYEDAPRVAQLKTRPERFAQIRAEHRVKPGERFIVEDFLAPDPPQLYGMLPASLGRAVRRLGHLLRKDFDALSWTMRVRTSGPFGYLQLRAVAALRHIRGISLRHREEQAAIARWTEAVRRWLDSDPALAFLAADAGRVVKGYGRVRNLALADLWAFLDEGLPALRALAEQGGDALATGTHALRTLASEAGKGQAALAVIAAERARRHAA